MSHRIIPQVSEAQRRQYDTFGYVVFPQVFTPAEVAQWGGALDAVLRAQRGGGDFAGTQSERITPLVEADPETFVPVLDDKRLLALAAGPVGDDCLYTGSNDGNPDVGDTVWHIDGGGWLLSDRLLETAAPRRRQKLAKLYEMGL